MGIFGSKGEGEGDVTADKSEVDAVYKINLKHRSWTSQNCRSPSLQKKVIGAKR